MKINAETEMFDIDLSELSLEQLKDLYEVWKAAYNRQKEMAAITAKSQYRVGQIVEFCNLSGKNAYDNGKKLQIIKLNPKKVRVKEVDNPLQTWNADYSVIRPVEKEDVYWSS